MRSVSSLHPALEVRHSHQALRSRRPHIPTADLPELISEVFRTMKICRGEIPVTIRLVPVLAVSKTAVTHGDQLRINCRVECQAVESCRIPGNASHDQSSVFS